MQNTGQSALGLLVLYTLPQEPSRWEALRGGQWTVLSFLSEEEGKDFLDASATRGIEVTEIVRAAQVIDAAALRTREKYCAFIADWPERFRHRGRNFKEMFTYRGELAYWWLSYASMKHNETRPTFQYLCDLEIIREALKTGMWQCVLIGHDPMIALLVSRACANLDVPFHAPGVGSVKLRRWALRGLVGRFWFAWKLLARLVVFRLFFRTRRSNAGAAIAFHTLFPTLVRLSDGELVDRHYRDLPGFVSQKRDIDTAFLATFSPESWRDWRLIWTQRKALRPRKGPRLVLLEGYLSFSDLALAISNLPFVIRYGWMDRMDRTFRESFQYDGINVFELVGSEFARDFLGNAVPSNLILARLVERAMRDQPFTHLVSFAELYAAARAVYYGAKKGRPDVMTVAYQHANINRMKIYHSYLPTEIVPQIAEDSRSVATMPLPDLYLFQGESGRRVIQESGYPRERCRVTGSPRYNALGHLLRTLDQEQPPTAAKSNGCVKTVLVTPSVEPQQAQELVETCVKACAGSPLKLRVQVKPHPSTPMEETIPILQKQYEFPDLCLMQGDLYQLIRDADVVVASYSTAGDEAIALGRPVICYTGLRPSMSSFIDVPAAPVVHDVGELRTALERMLNDSDYLEAYRTQWPALIESSFYRLDGLACQRMLEALLG